MRLAVIRDHKLIKNYALAIYQMKNMETVGLHSLIHILKGRVKIEKNLTLCYVKTINWRNIVVDTIHQEHRGKPQGTDVSFFMSTVDTVLGNRHCGKSF